MSRKKVVILGGGFAGLACANALDSQHFAVTLVDRKRYFEFLPNIHELVSGVKRPSAVRLPLGPNLRAQGHRFVCADIVAIDPDGPSAQLSTGRELNADYLVIGLGSADATYGVSGVARHVLSFKSADQCQAIHDRLELLCREGAPRVTLIGGGITGVEALGEILRRYGPALRELRVVEAQDQLLPGGRDSVSAHLAQHCNSQGVELILGDAVQRITAKTVLLGSGKRLRSDLTIWTGGPAPPQLLSEAGLSKPGTWVEVDANLQHTKHPSVFVAGDCAQLPKPLRKQAYHALDMGRCVADNLQRLTSARRLRRFRPAPKPTLIAFGELDTLLVSEPIAVAGPALAAAKEAVFTAVMTQLDQRGSKSRARALVARGRNASRELLWPRLADWRTLLRQAQLKRLP